MSRLPIEYAALIRANDGHEGSVDLEEPGWRDREDVRGAAVFTLQPKEGASLPLVIVELVPLPDGTPRELVYFSKVCGRLSTNGDGDQTDLIRLYCVGWKARIAERLVEMRTWIYPGGQVVVVSDEPPLLDALMDAIVAASAA